MANGRGQLNGNATLTVERVLAIRRMSAERSASVRDMCSMYGLSAESIRRVIRRETWAWLRDDGTFDPVDVPGGALPQGLAAKAEESINLLMGRMRAEGIETSNDTSKKELS